MGSKFGVKSKMMICSKQNVQAINEQAPDLIAKVTLYGEEACKGAKIIQPGDLCKCVGCPVGIGERIDAWLQIGDFDLQPGQTRIVGFCFFAQNAFAKSLKEAAKFYLWDNGLIGEAIVLGE